MLYPQLVNVKKVSGSYTASSVGAGASVDATITLSSKYLIIGVPKITLQTANADAVFINGGKNTFSVRLTNNDASAQDITIDYEAYVITGM